MVGPYARTNSRERAAEVMPSVDSRRRMLNLMCVQSQRRRTDLLAALAQWHLLNLHSSVTQSRNLSALVARHRLRVLLMSSGGSGRAVFNTAGNPRREASGVGTVAQARFAHVE